MKGERINAAACAMDSELCDAHRASSFAHKLLQMKALRAGDTVNVRFASQVNAETCCTERAVLTGDGAQVEVVPYDLLQLVVQRALLKLETEVVAQVRVQHFTCSNRGGNRKGQ